MNIYTILAHSRVRKTFVQYLQISRWALKSRFLLLFVVSLFTSNISFAQVLNDNNSLCQGADATGSSLTISSLTVPANNNVALVVLVRTSQSQTVSNITFNAQNLTRLGSPAINGTARAEVWYLALGNVSSSITSDIAITLTGNSLYRIATATSFHNVNQTEPLNNLTSNNFIIGATTSSLSVSGNDGDMTVEAISSIGFNVSTPPTFAPGNNQTELSSCTEVPQNSLRQSTAYLAQTGASATLGWGISDISSTTGNGIQIAANIQKIPSCTPSVSIVSDDADNSITSGTSVTFTATPTNGGTTPQYQWKKNGTNVGTNSATYTDAALAHGDVITCVMTSSDVCASPTTATSSAITMTVTCAPPTVSISNTGATACLNSAVLSLNSSNTVSQIQWYNGATLVNTATSSSPAKTGTTVAGGNGSGSAANQLKQPSDVFVDGSGNIYVADQSNHRIQKWAPGASTGTTVAGGNGLGSAANQFNTPVGIYVDGSGNIYVADQSNHRIQKWAPGATTGTTVAGGNGAGSAANKLFAPNNVYVDGSGNVYVSDQANNRIQKWAPGATTGTTVAGGNGQGSGANQFSNPYDVYVDGSGNIYVADLTNHRIQKWAPGATTGTTVAGGNGSGSAANQFTNPIGVYVDGSGNIYVADGNNNRIQKWASGASTGTTVAGGNGGGSAANQFSSPSGVYVDGSGNIYVAEKGNNRIQKWGSGAAVTTYKPTAAGSYTAFVTDANGCTATTAAYTVNEVSTPSVSIAASPSSSITIGTSVTFTATPTNGGTTPTYQWKKNGTNVGTNSATYTDAALVNGDKITCVMTSNDPCASPTTATSNEITMQIFPAGTVCVTTTCGTYAGNYSPVNDPGVTITNGMKNFLKDADGNLIFFFTPANAWFIANTNGGGINPFFKNASTDQNNVPLTGWFPFTFGDTPCNEALSITRGPCIETGCTNPTAYTVTGGGAYCAGGAGVAIGLSNSETGVTYQLKDGTTAVGSPVSGTGAAISFGNQTTAGTYTVEATRTTGGCTAKMTGNAVVTVNPIPTVNPLSFQTVCNNTSTAAFNFSGDVSGTVYKWTNNKPSIGLAASGTGNIAAFTATNTTTATVTATITVTPSYTNGGVTCDGTPKNFYILVDPTPTVNSVANQTVCNASSTTAVNFTGSISGTTFNWTNNTPSIGLAASGTGNIAAFTATNTSNAPITATITVTPSIPTDLPGGAFPDGHIAANTCDGTPITFTITVNPTPVVNTVTNQTVCNASSTTAVTFSSPTTGGTIVYNWTNNTPSIGLAASGTGDIAAFTATNTTNAPITATITVTPSVENEVPRGASEGFGALAGTICTGTPITFTITVNPTATVNAISNQVVCNTSSTAAVTFSSPTTGGTIVYNWTNNTPSVGLAASGSGNIASFTATNTTNAPVTATITVTPSYTNGGVTCTGTASTFTITVNPTPSVTQPSNQAICNAFATTAIAFTGTVTGTVYKWTNNNTSIGLAASGTGSIASFTGINTTDAPAVATITVTPYATFGGVECVGASKTFTITVNPTPRITSITPISPSIQFGTNGRIELTVAGGTDPKSYAWKGTNNFMATTQVPTVTGLSTSTYSVTLTDANGCQAFASTYLPDGAPVITCPQPAYININQLDANGVALPSVTGQPSTLFNVNQITYNDNVYDVRCGVVTAADGSAATINYSSNNINDVVRIISRLYKTAFTNSSISYYCNQLIYIKSYQLTDIEVPSNATLLCANSPTDPSVTGKPNIRGAALGVGLTNNLSATYTDERITNANGFTIKRTWVLKNECTGEKRTVVQNLTYTVGTCPTTIMSVSGKIQREDLMDVPAKIMLYNAANEMLNSTTATNYNFNNLLVNNRYRITPERPNTDWTNGVTTFDIALVSQHVLGINAFATPYQIIAADVNRSGEVDATDMLLMRRLILRQNVDFPNNNSWRFVNKNYQFQVPSNPFASDFPETLIVPNLTNSITNGDFVAIKVGDVNGSLGSVNIRGGVEAFKLMVEDKALEKGKTYEIPVRITPTALALQYALNVDKNAAQIVNIASGDLPNCADNNFGLFKNEGIVTAAWNQSPNQKLSDSDSFTMLYVTIKPTVNARLSDVLSINPVYTEGVAYDAVGTGAPVKLSFGNTTKVSDKLVLLPNRPNPFSDATTISFIMSETSVAKVTVFDLLGKVLMTTEKEFTKGINEVVFDAKTTPSVSNGILVVRLQTAKGLAEQKIVFSH